MSQIGNIMGGVADWLRERVPAAPAHVAEQWAHRAKLYEAAAHLTAYERRNLFMSPETIDQLDLEKRTPHVLPAETVATWAITGPPNTLRIRLRGELGTANMEALEHEIERADRIQIEIDCLGGSAMQAIRLYGLLASKDCTALVVGTCYSAATVVLMAARHRTAKREARFMVHAPSVFVAGDARLLQAAANMAKDYQMTMRDLFVARTGQPQATVESWLSADTYFDASEALKAGLIDEIALDNATEAEPPRPK